MTARTPKVFVSYSHDDQEHKDWVLTLATRLVANGVDVILDQWDLTLGGDLPRFMESGLTEADRVLAICTRTYVAKANAGKGGVGYEKMILTAQVMQDATADRIIPIIRCNDTQPLVPTFLGARVYVDFRDIAQYEPKYAELMREIHGIKIKPRPPLGANPFTDAQSFSTPKLSNRPERLVSPALSSVVTVEPGVRAIRAYWQKGERVIIRAVVETENVNPGMFFLVKVDEEPEWRRSSFRTAANGMSSATIGVDTEMLTEGIHRYRTSFESGNRQHGETLSAFHLAGRGVTVRPPTIVWVPKYLTFRETTKEYRAGEYIKVTVQFMDANKNLHGCEVSVRVVAFDKRIVSTDVRFGTNRRTTIAFWDFEIPSEGLSVGWNEIEAILVDADGNELERTSTTINIVP